MKSGGNFFRLRFTTWFFPSEKVISSTQMALKAYGKEAIKTQKAASHDLSINSGSHHCFIGRISISLVHKQSTRPVYLLTD
jgi:hypothetical protein